jgi:ribosomal protein S18 acetylase RimI-like enzyme
MVSFNMLTPTEMSEALTIRRALLEQVNDVRDLTLRAYQKWVSITPRKPRPLTADYNTAILDHRFDCLYRNEVLVGLIETVRQGIDLMIVNVAVDPYYQGRGYGTRLMRYAELLACEQRLSATRLYTNKLMIENIALYKKLGYCFEKETFHDHGTVAVHMVRPLSNDT